MPEYKIRILLVVWLVISSIIHQNVDYYEQYREKRTVVRRGKQFEISLRKFREWQKMIKSNIHYKTRKQLNKEQHVKEGNR